MNYAKAQIGGRLTKDPETKQVGETSVTEFSVAVNEKYKDKESTSFFDMKCWGKKGEVIAQYFTKGKGIFCACRVSQESWEKDGQRKSKMVFTVEDFQFLGDGNKSVQREEEEVPAGAGTEKNEW